MRLVSIEGDGYHIMVPARVNGKKASMLIDTGASRTVFDVNRIRHFLGEHHKDLAFDIIPQLSAGLGTNTLESRMTVIDKFQVGKSISKDFHAILLDMAHVNQSYEMLGLRPIDGVIGSDLLMQWRAQINFLNQTLKIFL